MKNVSVTTIKGVGAESAKKLARLSITTVEDLLFHLPYRYEDYSNIQHVDKLQPGPATVRGTIHIASSGYRNRGKHITTGALSDETGQVSIAWFNQPYRKQGIDPEAEYYVSGVLQFDGRTYSFTNPSMEKVDTITSNAARVLPIYPETKGLSSKQLRTYMREARAYVSGMEQLLPASITSEAGMIASDKFFEYIHFPESMEQAGQARQFYEFFEIFALMLSNQLNRKSNDELSSPSVEFKKDATVRFIDGLPFKLTDAQRKASWKIITSMAKAQPMNRLLEGDVGSGKTVVATIAMLNTVLNGHQAALMAPTELLSMQHAQTVSELLSSVGVSVALVTSSMTAKQRRTTLEKVATGEATVVVGTQALLQPKVKFKSLGLLVVDEQHRFGVKQRQELMLKSALMPHVLSMTATPIPRTLALTVYGELDISVLNERPVGRKPVQTSVVSHNSTTKMQQNIFLQLQKGHQGFVVFPLIEASETLQVRNVVEAYEKAKVSTYKDWKVGLLHGRLSSDEKDEVMRQFVAGEIDILFTTTVIEVGVDVPNATFMVIESAERFGLAQLHQLRGRIGRSSNESFCYIMPTTSQSVPRRLRELARIHDGFKLAELDLSLRGPGAIYGTRQHGSLDVRMATFDDARSLSRAQELAALFVSSGEDLVQYPRLVALVDASRTITKLN